MNLKQEPLTPEEQDILARYHAHGHAIQTGIKVLMETGNARQCETKHMRTGIDLSKVDHAALVELLVEKGLFTRTEYFRKLEMMAARERERYQDEVQRVLGPKFTLG